MIFELEASCVVNIRYFLDLKNNCAKAAYGTKSAALLGSSFNSTMRSLARKLCFYRNKNEICGKIRPAKLAWPKFLN